MKIHGTALVTGASAGIGAEYARQLARRGCDVILVARRADRLEALAREIGTETGRKATAIAADLADPQGVRSLLDHLTAVPDMLVNNAGRGTYGAAIETPMETVLGMVRLNMEALTVLSLELGRKMAARGSGCILNVASTVGYQPLPYFAVYAATKAYVVSFSEALAAELHPKGVKVFTVSPGATKSEFGEVAGLPAGFASFGVPAATLVRRSLDAYEGQVWGDSYIDGALNRVGAVVSQLTPNFVLTHFTAGLLRPR